MAELRTVMDSAFWDLNVATPRTLDGVARSIPGEPLPMDLARASIVHRVRQMRLIKRGFPLGLIPSYSYSHKENASFALQSLLLNPISSNWWLGLVGQIHPKKFISALKADIQGLKKWDVKRWEWDVKKLDLPVFKKFAKNVIDKSPPFSIGLTTHLSLSPSSSLLLSTEKDNDGEGSRKKALFYHRLPEHDITLEAAWPELFIDQKGKYWNVPESISLDCLSAMPEPGLRYRFGIHKNRGQAKKIDNSRNMMGEEEVPVGLMPGLCAKAAFSYEQKKDFWRITEKLTDFMVDTPYGPDYGGAFDPSMRDPHAAVSGIIGGSCGAWFGGVKSKNRAPFSADLFGSACYTYQHGQFRKRFNDLTRIDARLDLPSAKNLAKRAINIFTKSSLTTAEKTLSSPRLNLTFQQQILWALGLRVDSRIMLDSSPEGRWGPHIEDMVYSLTYSVRQIPHTKVVAWYSPKRKEAMLELRAYEYKFDL